LYDGQGDYQTMLVRVNGLLERLPEPTGLEQLAMLLKVRRWDYEDGELTGKIEAQVRLLDPAGGGREIFGLLEQEQANAWEAGRALAAVQGESQEVIDRLVALRASNPEALIGYLSGLVGAFDRFLTTGTAASFPPLDRVQIAVRGPVTDQTKQMIMQDLRDSPLTAGISALFGWYANIQLDEAADMLGDWFGRLASQLDYNALVEWVYLQFRTWQELPTPVQDQIFALVLKRREYPKVSRQLTSWAQLAEHQAERHATEVFRMLLELLDARTITIHRHEADTRVLTRCARLNPPQTWDLLSAYLVSGSWRVILPTAHWLIDAFPIEVIAEWVDHDVTRARAVAFIASAGGDEPSPVARLLLEEFWQDKDVSSRLAGAFVSGMWWGNESAHISGQIDQLNAWRRDAAEPIGVRNWARDLAASLAEDRHRVLEQEAEERP
jgi:hypothetical protein